MRQCDNWQEKSDYYIKVFERSGESVSSRAQCVISGSNYSPLKERAFDLCLNSSSFGQTRENT